MKKFIFLTLFILFNVIFGYKFAFAGEKGATPPDSMLTSGLGMPKKGSMELQLNFPLFLYEVESEVLILDIRPGLGYFVTDNIAIGGRLLFFYLVKEPPVYMSPTTSLGLLPFVKAFFGISKKIAFAVEFVFGFSFVKSSGDLEKIIAMDIGLGPEFFIISNWSISTKFRVEYTYNLDDKAAVIPIIIMIGTSVYF
jgi:hypothetical protein